MEQKYDFVEVTLEPSHYELVKELYRLYKEQSNRIFDLASGINTNEDILDYIKFIVEEHIVLIAIDKETQHYAGCIVFDELKIYNNEIISCGVHIVIGKKYWGKESRKIIKDCWKYIKENMLPVRRIECKVPSNNFGIIKLLKDVGFKIEGTLKNRVLRYNKNNIPTLYNELVYSNINLEETLNGD